MANRSDAWLAGVSRGPAAQMSYQNAQARLGDLTANMNNLLAAFEAARDAFAENPGVSGKEVVDAAYSAYMASQEEVTAQQNEMSAMQQMYAENMEAPGGDDGQRQVLGAQINGIVDRIEELEGSRRGYVGALRFAQEFDMQPDMELSVPESVDDWKSFSESFGQEDTDAGAEEEGHGATVQGLTDAISRVDTELMALYQTYDQLRSQYDNYGASQNKGLQIRQRTVMSEKTLDVPYVMQGMVQIAQTLSELGAGKELNIPDPEQEVVIADASGYTFNAMDLEPEEDTYDPNAGAEERLFANVEAIEANMAREDDFSIDIPGSW